MSIAELSGILKISTYCPISVTRMSFMDVA